MQDQKGCKKNNICAEEEQITAARAKHEDEEDTGIRPEKKGQEFWTIASIISISWCI